MEHRGLIYDWIYEKRISRWLNWFSLSSEHIQSRREKKIQRNVSPFLKKTVSQDNLGAPAQQLPMDSKKCHSVLFFSCPFLNSLILFLCSFVFVFLSGLGVILSLRRVTTSAEVRIGYLALQRDAFYIDSRGFHESSHMYRPVCEKPQNTSELTSYLY